MGLSPLQQYSTRAPRELVHRTDDSEVFVTHPENVDGKQHFNIALLPEPANAYYYDGHDDPARDPIFLAEAMRQAAMSGAHKFSGVPKDISMFFLEMTMDIQHSNDKLASRRTSSDAMRIDTHLEDLRFTRSGAPRHIEYSQTASIDGRSIATTNVVVQGAARTKYNDLRTYQRSGRPAPRTSSQPRRATHAIVHPSTVGRRHPMNVVLGELAVAADSTTAMLSPDYTNPSLFDHDYDHIPGLVLLEAARQIVYAANQTSHSLQGFHATFKSFAELDSPLLVEHKHEAASETVVIKFIQEENLVAVVTAPFRLTDHGEQR